MTEKERTRKGLKRLLPRVLIVSGVVLCLSLASVYLATAVYVRTPSAARRAEQILTDYLHYPVTITSLGLTGGTLSIRGLRINSPGEFKGEFLSSRSIAITPDWIALLRGRNIFREIALRELSVAISRNRRGELNVDQLIRDLSRQKGGDEIFIQRLVISQAAITMEGFRLHNLAFNLRDFSTKGTTGARFLLTCKDVDGDILRLEGTGRLGAVPSLEMAFSAPSVSLQALAQSFGRKAGRDLGSSKGSISLAIRLHERIVAAQGKFRVDHLPLAIQNYKFPVSGELDFGGRYDIGGDQAFLDACSLRLNGIVDIQGSGTMRQVRSKKTFDAALSIQPIDLKAAYAMLPQELRHDLVAGGALSASIFRFSGDAVHGITAGSGSIIIRDGKVERGDRSFIKRLSAEASLTKVKDGWQARGQLFQKKGEGGLVEALKAPFTVLLSSGFKLLTAETPSFSAKVSGFPVKGRIGYEPAAPTALSFRVDVRKARLAHLNRILAARNMTFSSGTADFSIEAAGNDLAEFKGKVSMSSSGLLGSIAGKSFAAGETVTEAALTGADGKVSADGKLRVSAVVVDGERAEIAFGYLLNKDEFTLSEGTLKAGGSLVTFEKMHGQMPLPAQHGRLTKVPLHFEMTGLAVRNGKAHFDDGAGAVALHVFSGDGKRWLEGSADLLARKLSYNSTGIGSVEAALQFAESGGTADIHGKVLAGAMKGTANFDPFDRNKKAAFSIYLDAVRCSELAAFAPASLPLKAESGFVSVKTIGEYAAGPGLKCRMEVDGHGIALTGNGGKTLLGNGTVRGLLEFAGDSLSIRELSATAGNVVTVKGRGELDHPFSPGRTGNIIVSLGATPLDTLFTAVINSLPRNMQEASPSGTIGADGTIRISQKQVLLDGKVSLHRAGVEIASQNLTVADITGTIPVSLDFSGGEAETRPGKRIFSRENFPSLVADLKQARGSGQTCKIGRIRFGNMEFSETTLAFQAGNGMTEMTTFRSSLFEGSLLGEGFLRYGKKLEYGADLTVSDLSLRTLCNAYPNIKGYITGRVDGIVSLYGEGTGMNGLRGFVEIWTRSAKGEKMLVSKEFLQKLAGRKFKGIFFRTDRPYDRGAIRGYLEKGYLTFDTLDISHTNFFGVNDLSVTVAPVQNRIALGHLVTSIREAATRGKTGGEGDGSPPPIDTDFKWQD